MGRPASDEAAPYYWRYIDRVVVDDVLGLLEAQRGETRAALEAIPDSRSAYRYAPDKWSIRELVAHVSDTERVFQSRAFWFARGFQSALPDFEQTICAQAGRAQDVPWLSLIADFDAVRASTLTFFRTLPAEGWGRRGVASGNPFTVRALAYITAGHVAHHLAVLRERYA